MPKLATFLSEYINERTEFLKRKKAATIQKRVIQLMLINLNALSILSMAQKLNIQQEMKMLRKMAQKLNMIRKVNGSLSIMIIMNPRRKISIINYILL